MLFGKALISLLITFTVCVSAAPTGKRTAPKAVATKPNGGASSRAPTKANTKVKLPAKGKSSKVSKTSKRKIPVKYLRAKGDKRLAAVPRDLESSSLEELYARANPTAANAMTFYRAVGEAGIEEANRLMNQSPSFVSKAKGDFAVDGAYYMFATKSEAEQIAAEKLEMGAKKAAVLTLSWTPPTSFKLKRWDSVDDEWREFTELCSKGGTTRPAIQTSFDFLEGPMSTKIGGKREQHESYYQYVIPTNAFDAMKANLKITAVEEIKLTKKP